MDIAESSYATTILIGVVSSIVYKLVELILVALQRIYNAKKGDFFFLYRTFDFHTVLATLTLVALLSLWYFELASHFTILFLLALLAANSIITNSLRMGKLKKIGIAGVDREIEKGLNYKDALRLVRSDLMFLGTGGHKLTILKADFERAISSASQSSKVKFLLCHPDSKALEDIANQAKKDVGEYRQNVLASLRIIDGFIQTGRKIEVRFYKANCVDEMPIFRLMFFNHHYCLCSYNIFGEGERKGEKTPQMHLHDHPNANGTNSFYIAFERYFDRLWETSYHFSLDDVLNEANKPA